MIKSQLGGLFGLTLFAGMTIAHAADDPVKRGELVSIIGGCHDCHTVGYNESAGKIDPGTALKGSPVGWRGPWGTTYPTNLRLSIEGMSEQDFVDYATSFTARPPMPYYNVHAIEEPDLKALYAYIKSLGAAGDAAPEYLPPDQEPKTPYIVLAPPVMPK